MSVNLPSLLSSRHLNSSGPLTRRRLWDSPTTWGNTTKQMFKALLCTLVSLYLRYKKPKSRNPDSLTFFRKNKVSSKGKEANSFERHFPQNIPFYCLLDEPNTETQATLRGLTCLLSEQINVSLAVAIDWPTLAPPIYGAFMEARNCGFSRTVSAAAKQVSAITRNGMLKVQNKCII